MNQREQALNKNLRAILLPSIAILLIGLVYFGYLTLMAGSVRFIADDFCSYNSAASLGWPRYMWFWFITWGGRLSAISADMLLVILGQKYIGYASMAAILVWVAAFGGIIFELIDSKIERRSRWIISAAAAMALVFSLTRAIPNFIQSLFWFSAFRTHTLPIILFTVWVFLAARVRSLTKFQNAAIAGLFFYAFANAAFSEVFTTLQISVLGLIIVYLWFAKPAERGSSVQKILLAGLLGGVAGLALMFFAPGTSGRETFFSGDRSILGIAGVALDGSLAFYRVIFKQADRTLAVVSGLLFVFSIAPYLKEIRLNKKAAALNLLLLLALNPLLVFVAFLPGAYGMGDWIPRRAWSAPIFFSFSAMGLFMLILAQHLRTFERKPNQLFGLFASVALLLASFITSLPSLNSDLLRMRQYAITVDRVEAEIDLAKANGDTTHTLEKLGNWAGVYDPSDNPKFWVTQCYSKFQAIEVIGPPSE